MLIRILGIVVGLLFVAFPFFDSTNPKAWIAPFMGVPFVAYGVGGQRLLAKIAPSWAKKSDKDKP
jgi:hypothetical protein